jgi:hypothetical protein
MPSTIGYTGYNGLGGPTANYLKAKPSTRFSTRDLAFVVIDMDNSSYFDNYTDSDSNFAKVVRAVQLQAEIYAIGTPNSGYVTFVVAKDTTNDGDNISETPGNPAQMNDMAFTIAQAMNNAGVGPDSVSIKKLYGNGFAGDSLSTWYANGSTNGSNGIGE